MNHLTIENRTFNTHFPGASFAICHNLVDSPLFELPRLVELSRVLPEDLIEYNSGALAVNQDPTKTPVTGLSVADTLANIETCGSWVILKQVERDPDYRRLFDDCLDQIADLANGRIGDLSARAGFIFVSSAKSVTPFHFDPELNFLMQIRGAKTFHCFPPFDRSLITEEALEVTYAKPEIHRNQVFKDEFQTKARTFNMAPGDGVFVPLHAPHWVESGEEFSVSFSITFTSAESRSQARLYKLNGLLRQHLRLAPTPVGQNPRLDALKDTACRGVAHAKRLLRRSLRESGQAY